MKAFGEGGHSVGAQGKLVAKEVFGAEQGGGSGTGECEVVEVGKVFLDGFFEVFGGEAGFVFVAPAQSESAKSFGGRITELLAKFDFLFVEADVVVSASVLDGGMKGGEGLDEDFAFDVAAAGATGNLGKQLEGALAGAKVGEVKAEVCVDDAHEGYIGKVESFGDHLGS